MIRKSSMKFVRSTGYIRLIVAILYIASFTIIVLFPNLYSVRHVAILTVLLALTLLATQKSPIHRQVIRDVLLIAATIGVLEACIGLSHVNHLAIITGTFDNPTLFSMAISLSVPALLYFLDTEDKRIRYLVILCFIILSLAVVLSKSRTGRLSMSVATVLYNCSFYEKTISILQRYKESCTSYEAELMLANSYMFIGQNDMAEKSYTLAHYMCPVRFTPLYNLFKIYKRDNDIENMKRIGNQILTKRIKIYSSEIEIIRHNTRVELQRLSQHEN